MLPITAGWDVLDKLQWGRPCEGTEIVASATGDIVTTCAVVFERHFFRDVRVGAATCVTRM